MSIILDPKERFAFGKNWAKFLQHLSEEKILKAEKSLQEKLGVSDLKGKVFLDVGSGSGLFSLAAHRMGANVFSFDYDQDSVACTQYLKETYGKKDLDWTVNHGSVLDIDFLKKFGKVDILYSWGVLHHTGHMYQAFENVAAHVKNGGYLFLSIYNDQGKTSQVWKVIKRAYIKAPIILKNIILFACFLRLWGPTFIKDFMRLQPFKTWTHYVQDRGMSPWHDVIDWVGGYPFEVAKPEEIFSFFKGKGFKLEKLKTCAGGLGCNEFIFVKE